MGQKWLKMHTVRGAGFSAEETDHFVILEVLYEQRAKKYNSV